MTQQEIMVTLIFGSGALIAGFYFVIFSYASGFKDVYGYGQTKTLYEVVSRTLIIHIAIVAVAVMFINAFEIMSGFDIYGGISNILKTDWFQLVRDTASDREDIKTAALILGYIRIVTVMIIAIGPVAIFFAIIVNQFSECVRNNQQTQNSKGTLSCAVSILAPAIFFLIVYFIHITFGSVLIGGADTANPDHDFLRQIGIDWWRHAIGVIG